MKTIWILPLYILASIYDIGKCARIVFMPAMIPSHIMSKCRIGQDLSSEGHAVYAIINSAVLPKVSKYLDEWNIKPLVYSHRESSKEMRRSNITSHIHELTKIVFRHGISSNEHYNHHRHLPIFAQAECEDIMQSTSLLLPGELLAALSCLQP